MTKKIDVWMVGSIGIDDVETRDVSRTNLLGGSLPFATIAASFAGAKVGAVGVVGSDFPKTFEKRWNKFLKWIAWVIGCMVQTKQKSKMTAHGR